MTVALLNLGYGIIEFASATSFGSVALFADSVDFFEDASVNLLIFLALAWSARRRARVGMVLAVLLLVPAAAAAWTLVARVMSPVAPDAMALGLTGLGALLVNVTCALLLARVRNQTGSLTRAAYLSARNDAAANIAIILAGGVTAWLWPSPWPDIIVGAGIAWLNIDAAMEVWEAARQEHRAAQP
jgi:Co/Zn/Cd efflux system component